MECLMIRLVEGIMARLLSVMKCFMGAVIGFMSRIMGRVKIFVKIRVCGVLIGV